MKEVHMEISLFATVRSKQPQNITLAQFVDFVRGERWMHHSLEYRRLRKLGDAKAAAVIKSGMEAITPGGTFAGGHRATQLIALSGVLCLDLDDTNERTGEIIACLRQMPWVVLIFRSISGEGLKVMVRIGISKVEEYAALYAAAMREVEQRVQFACDPACRDVCHLCYGSYDPQAYYNPEAVAFCLPAQTEAAAEQDQRHASQHTPQQHPERIPQPEAQGEVAFLAAIRQLNKKMLYVKSNRNVYLYNLLCRLNRQGMPAQQAQQLALHYFEVEPQELDAIIRSAYSHANEHGSAPQKSREEKKQAAAAQRQQTIGEVEAFVNERYALRFNTVSNRVEFFIRPQQGEATPPADWQPLTDYDENSIYRALLLAGFQLTLHLLRSILKSSFVPRFDPFVAYFASLPPWDGVTDYIAQLAASVTTTRPEYWTRCFRKWLVAMVASWLRPEVVNHTVLVLIGAQGIYKTTWCMRLMPPELERYRYSGVIDPHNKDSLFTLSQCGLINHEEIENLVGRELNEFKALISQPIINERAAYGHNKEYLMHRASFIGSGNNEDILTDSTGNRRWICEKVLSILSAEAYAFPYMGIYAQAKALLDSGFRYWFDKEEVAELNAGNSDFVLRSVEEEQLAVWFRHPQQGEMHRLMTASQVMGRLMEWVHVPMSVVRVGRALKTAGYEAVKLRGIKCYKMVEMRIEEVRQQGQNEPEEAAGNEQRGQDGGGLMLPF